MRCSRIAPLKEGELQTCSSRPWRGELGHQELRRDCGTDLLQQGQRPWEQVPLHINSLGLDGPPALAAPEVLKHLLQQQHTPVAGSLAEALLDGLCCQRFIGCQNLRIQVGIPPSQPQQLHMAEELSVLLGAEASLRTQRFANPAALTLALAWTAVDGTHVSMRETSPSLAKQIPHTRLALFDACMNKSCTHADSSHHSRQVRSSAKSCHLCVIDWKRKRPAARGRNGCALVRAHNITRPFL